MRAFSAIRIVALGQTPAAPPEPSLLSNMPEFQKAFSCKAGDPMVRVDACRVW